MKLNSTDINNLRTALLSSRVIEAAIVVLRDGKILGVNEKRDAAIISELPLSMPTTIKVGIGRVDELLKRLSLFGENIEADLKVNDKEEVSQITLSSGRTKAQFRCTAMSMLERKYPQENADQPGVVLTMSVSEVSSLVRATRTFGSESVVVKIDPDGTVLLECSDSNNDRFGLTLEKKADFVEQAESTVFMYRADVFASLINAGSKETEELSIIIGQEGSATALVNGHSLILMPLTNGE